MASPLEPRPEPPRGVLADPELQRRILSAAVLAAASLAATWLGGWAYLALVAVFAAVTAWEWGRLVRGRDSDVELVLHVAVLLAALVMFRLGSPLSALAALAAGALGLAIRRRPEGDWLSGAGVLYVGLPALAMLWLRGSDEAGWLAVLFLYLCVWATDTFAYAGGRGLGGPKLWPRVSPKKTWSGALSGLAAAIALGAAFAVATGLGIGRLMLSAGLISIATQLGDLIESALKRRFGRKDASGLVPGHGGLLDRIDGLILAALVAAALAAVGGPPEAPGAALLGWP